MTPMLPASLASRRDLATTAPTDHLPLPSIYTRRWTSRRKAAVVNAVAAGAITLQEACARWQLSPEELAAWQQALAAAGVAGLRATRRWPPPARRSRYPRRIAAGAALSVLGLAAFSASATELGPFPNQGCV